MPLRLVYAQHVEYGWLSDLLAHMYVFKYASLSLGSAGNALTAARRAVAEVLVGTVVEAGCCVQEVLSTLSAYSELICSNQQTRALTAAWQPCVVD